MAEERSCVLDASALLAMLQEEPGGDVVQELLETAAISSVNWSEVVQKSLERQMEIDGLRHDLEALGLEILPFTGVLAETTARLRSATRQAGLSLGDRACLALAAVLGLPAITTDRIWPDLGLPIKIRVVR
ncbi:MAG TPA: type II toxin-antitoxin system VapC family toxin [Thermoanaerobaculia bacterium]